MIPVACFFILFGTVAEVLGFVAWSRAGSKASLIAGVVSGMLLTVAGVLGLTGWTRGALVVGGLVSLALCGRFLPGFLRKRKLYPDGLMAGLAIIGLVLAVVNWH